jgi:flap endonuclease-1
MGIKGLKNLIKKYAPEALTKTSIYELRNTTICIDASILLYRFRYNYQSDNFHLIGILNKIVELRNADISPIFVFDGKPPDAKKEILLKRAELRNKSKEKLLILQEELNNYPTQINTEEYINSGSDSESENIKNVQKIKKEIEKIQKNTLYVNKIHTKEVIELLKSIGVPFFESFGEAEESCVFLQKNNFADYILTEDTDSLTFGGNNILFSSIGGFMLCNLNKILNDFQLTHSEFIDLCILCGCDYTPGIPKLGPISAFKIIKEFKSIESFLEKNKKYLIPPTFNYQLARELFNQNNNYQTDVLFNFNQFNQEEFKKNLLKYNIELKLKIK